MLWGAREGAPSTATGREQHRRNRRENPSWEINGTARSSPETKNRARPQTSGARGATASATRNRRRRGLKGAIFWAYGRKRNRNRSNFILAFMRVWAARGAIKNFLARPFSPIRVGLEHGKALHANRRAAKITKDQKKVRHAGASGHRRKLDENYDTPETSTELYFKNGMAVRRRGRSSGTATAGVASTAV